MEQAAAKIGTWAKKNKFELNPTKSEDCIFTNSLKDGNKMMGIRMGGKAIGNNHEYGICKTKEHNCKEDKGKNENYWSRSRKGMGLGQG